MRSMVPDRAKRSERPAWVREGRLAYTSAPTGHRLCGPRYVGRVMVRRENTTVSQLALYACVHGAGTRPPHNRHAPCR